MQVQETIVRLLDNHTEALGLTRRQVADLANTNAGQLSNWLRNAGPLHSTRTGKVADVVLQRVETALKRRPSPSGTAEMERLAAMLRSYGPRMRMISLDPAVAREGGPIALDNPLYMPRPLDEEVLNAIQQSPQRIIVVTGGAQTGKSTLLSGLQEKLERSTQVILVDCAQYIEQRPTGSDQRTAAKSFYNWLSERCEDQVGSSGGIVWNASEDVVPWLKSRILATTKGRKVVILLDHLDKLGEHLAIDGEDGLVELHALDLALRTFVEDPDTRSGLLDVKVVAALNCYGSKGYPANPDELDLLGRNFLPGTPSSLAVGPAEIRNLLVASGASKHRASDECVRAATFTGGHVRLAQAYAMGNNEGESKDAVLREVGQLAARTRQRSRGYPETIEDRPVAAMDTGLWAWQDPGLHSASSRHSIRPETAPEVIAAFLESLR